MCSCHEGDTNVQIALPLLLFLACGMVRTHNILRSTWLLPLALCGHRCVHPSVWVDVVQELKIKTFNEHGLPNRYSSETMIFLHNDIQSRLSYQISKSLGQLWYILFTMLLYQIGHSKHCMWQTGISFLNIQSVPYCILLHDYPVTSSLIGQKPPYTLAIKFI